MRTFLCLTLLICLTTERLQELYDAAWFYLDPPRFAYLILVLVAATILLLRKPTFGSAFRSYSYTVLLFAAALTSSALAADSTTMSSKRGLMYLTFVGAPLVSYVVINAASGHTAEGMVRLVRKILMTTALVVIVVSCFALTQVVFEFALHRVEMRHLMFIDLVRVNSLFNDPNFLACFLASALPLLWWSRELWVASLSRRTIPIAFFLGLTTLALTGSRGGALAFISAMGLCALLSKCDLASKRRARAIVALLVAVMPAVIFFGMTIPMEHLLATALEHDDETLSGVSRLFTWYGGYQLWRDDMILGIGPGNFTNAEKGEYLRGAIESWKIDVFSTLAGHSNFAEFLVEGGLVSGISFLLCMFTLTRTALASVASIAGIETLEPFRVAALGLTGALLAFGLATSLLSYFALWFGIYAGLLLSVADSLHALPRRQDILPP